MAEANPIHYRSRNAPSGDPRFLRLALCGEQGGHRVEFPADVTCLACVLKMDEGEVSQILFARDRAKGIAQQRGDELNALTEVRDELLVAVQGAERKVTALLVTFVDTHLPAGAVRHAVANYRHALDVADGSPAAPLRDFARDCARAVLATGEGQ